MAGSLECYHAVALHGESHHVLRREPAGTDPFQIVVSDPTGTTAGPSRVDGNVVLLGKGHQVLQGR